MFAGVVRVTLACGIGLAFLAALASAVSASPATTQPTPLPIPPLPIDEALPPYQPKPDLVLQSAALDRGYYILNASWSVTFTVRNIGDGLASDASVVGTLCRDPQEAEPLLYGDPFLCGDEIVLAQGMDLDPDESLVRTSGPHSFASLPLDESPSYTSEGLAGLPDSGTIYLRLTARADPSQVERNPDNNELLTSAAYPTAPDDPAYDPAADGDGDGWMSSQDCYDSNPEVHPWHNEMVADGIDNNCAGGDAPYLPDCPDVNALFHNREEGCRQAPGAPDDRVLRLRDSDQDGYRPAPGPWAETDCDDFNAAIHPGAVEWDDDVDNDCDGLIDEGFVVPDWTIADFQLFRGWASRANLSGTFGTNDPFQVSVLHYSFEIANEGEPLSSDDSEVVDDLVLIQDLEGRLFAIGVAGFIPYTSFDYGGGFVPACDPIGLLAIIPDGGLYGETETSNNVAAASTPPQNPLANFIFEGPFDRDLRFAAAPILYPSGSMASNSEAIGTCPPLIWNTIDTVEPYMYFVRYRLYVNGDLITDDLECEFASPCNPEADYVDPESFRAGDTVCYEVVLDPQNFIMEVDEANNSWVQLLRYRNPLFGPPRFDLIDAYSDGPASCAGGDIVAGAPTASVTSSLTSSGSGLLLGGIGGALLLGALGGLAVLLIARRTPSGRPPPAWLAAGVLAGAASGFVAGGFAGAALLPALINERGPALAIQVPPDLDLHQTAQLPSCDYFLDPASASPIDGSTFVPGETLSADLSPLPDRELPPASYALKVEGPSGMFWGVWAAPAGNPEPIDLVGLALAHPARFIFNPGDYTWSVIAGFRDAEGAAPACRGSTVHTFALEGPAPIEGPVIAPTSLSTVPAIVITPTSTRPSPTRTPTAVPDTSGPTIKALSDSPDPIKVTQPKGCTPTTSNVSAAISDPSGVASAYVLFFHTSIGQVPMANSGGATWTATLGPYSGTGDGAVDYQIHAVDSLGNATDSAFGQITVLACLP
jgi:hypothetical protein